MKIGAVKSHTLTGGAKMNFSPYLPLVFFGVDPYVMMLSVRELRENRQERVILSYGSKCNYIHSRTLRL